MSRGEIVALQPSQALTEGQVFRSDTPSRRPGPGMAPNVTFAGELAPSPVGFGRSATGLLPLCEEPRTIAHHSIRAIRSLVAQLREGAYPRGCSEDFISK